MSDSMLTMAERERTLLRSAMAEVELHLSKLQANGSVESRSSDTEALAKSWRQMVALLAVEPEPDRRSCPFCSGPIMRLATRCVHCWRKSSHA